MQQDFPDTYATKKFTAKDITNWALMQDRFSSNTQLTNAWSLGKYFRTHAQLIEDSVLLQECAPVNNRKAYRIIPHVNLDTDEEY